MRFGLKEDDIGAINAIFSLYPTIDKVALYGSRAKGNYKPGSDIDLTIIEHGLTFDDLLQIERQLDDLLLPYTFDLSLFRKIDHPELLAHIQRVGVPFFARESPRKGATPLFLNADR